MAFMPKGMLSRLIVNLHDLIENDNLWRTGAIFADEDDKTRAEVVEHRRDRLITIRVTGEFKQELRDYIQE